MHQVKELMVSAVNTVNTVNARIRDGEVSELIQFVPPVTLLILPTPFVVAFITNITLNRITIDDSALTVMRALPFALLLLACLLGAVYRQTRVTFIAVFLIAVGLLVRPELSETALSPKGYASVFVGVLYLCIVVPSFFHANEQGLLNPHGTARLILTLSFIPCVALLPRISGFANQLDASELLLFRPFSTSLHIPVLDVLLAGVAILVLLVRNPRESPWLGPIMITAMMFAIGAHNSASGFWSSADRDIVFHVMLSMAAVSLLGAIVECLRHTAHIDELTEIPSRRSMNHYLSGLGHNYCLAMVDVDHFKRINDTYGHDTGDQALRFVASILVKHAPGKCFRYGGEEFAIIGAHADRNNFGIQVDQMRIRLHEEPFVVRAPDRPRSSSAPVHKKRGTIKNPRTIRISVSIGVAEPREEGESTQSVIERADKALYKAKSSGRNCVRTAS